MAPTSRGEAAPAREETARARSPTPGAQPAFVSTPCSRFRARSMRVWSVPSGTPSRAAASSRVSPSR
ncbi:MAG TPA: hypothetical protein VH092_18945 [Urbifossiella sp.]|nr:hypothetical protein [Urbifossiella sp.]